MNARRRLPVLILAAICTIGLSRAPAMSILPPDPGPFVPLGAVTVSLTVPGYYFWVDMMPSPVPAPRTYGSFKAVFMLANASGRPLDFDVVASASLLPESTRKVMFVIRDASGQEVWRRPYVDPRILAPTLIRPMPLPRNRIWRAAATIPLAPDGKPLPPGAYTLEAFINGTPRYSATAPFEVGYAY